MARRHLLEKLSGAELGLDEIWDWHEFQIRLIFDERIRTLNALEFGVVFDQPIYYAKTRDELDEFFNRQRDELDKAAMLSFLAATEAAIRVDFLVRVKNDKKDPITRNFASLYRVFGLKVSLEDQILDVWKQNSSRDLKEAIGDFRGSLILRHWLAHGRYWKPKLGRKYDAQDVFAICDSMLKLMAI